GTHAGTAWKIFLGVAGAAGPAQGFFPVRRPRRAGERRRWRAACSAAGGDAHEYAIRLRKQAMPSPRPFVSAASEVICTPGSPQATTQENGSRSFSTLTAKPCVEIPRETCTPSEA